MNNFDRIKEMVLIMYNILPEDASTEQISNALATIIAEDKHIAEYEAKKKTINWEDLASF